MNTRTSFRIHVPSLLATSALCAATLAASPHARADDAAAEAAAQGVSLDVAYIESTGAQYINSGVTMVPGLKAEIVASFANVADNGGLLGGRTGSSQTNHRYMMLWISNNRFYFSPGPNYNTVDHGNPSFSPVANKLYSIVSDFGTTRQTLTVDGVQYMSLSEQDYVSGSLPLYIFAGNWYGTSVEGMIKGARLYSLKLTTEAGVVVRDYVPARKNGVYGLWDKENRVFYGSASSTPFVGVDLDVPFCESSSAQHIDTGIPGNPGVRAEATFAFTALGGSDKALLASWKSGSERCVMIAKDGTGAGAHLTAGIDKFYNCEKGGASVSLALNQIYTVTADFQSSTQTIVIDGGAYDNDTVLNRSGAMANTDFNLHLFTLGIDNQQYIDSYRSSARLYSMKIWQDGTLVRDYVPARRQLVHGLYDKVSRTFVTSATSTPFVPVGRTAAGRPDHFAQWVQSNGSTYVDTGVSGLPGTKVEASFQWKEIKDCRLIGSWNGNSFIAGSGAEGQYSFNGLSGWVTLEGGAYAADTDYSLVLDVGASAQTFSVTGPSGTVVSNRVATAASGGTGNKTLFLFAQNQNGTGAQAHGKVRLYSMKITQDGSVVRDYVPGVRNGEGCLYDRVTDTCYFSADGSIAPVGLVGPPAPAKAPEYPAYQLSYLGSLGNAYVDTGVIGKPYTKAEISFRFTGTTGNAMSLIGSRNTSLSSQRFVMFRRNESSNLQYASGNWANPSTTTALAANTDYVMTSSFGYTGSDNHQVITLDGTKVHDGWAAMPDTGLPMFLLGHNVDGALSEGAVARIYYAKIWQRDANGNEQLVRNYVPVIADNGCAYLYDKVTKTFSQGGDAGLWDIGEVGERFHRGTSILIR